MYDFEYIINGLYPGVLSGTTPVYPTIYWVLQISPENIPAGRNANWLESLADAVWDDTKVWID